MPPTGSVTDMGENVSPWYPPRTVKNRFRGEPAATWNCSAIFIATSTDTDPESARKTCSSPSGVISISLRANAIAGSWVRPPNITWLIRDSWAAAAASSSGTAYPWIADHHDDMASTTSTGSPLGPRSRSRTPEADSTSHGSPGASAEEYGCQTCSRS
jgi:hypothetical protein